MLKPRKFTSSEHLRGSFYTSKGMWAYQLHPAATCSVKAELFFRQSCARLRECVSANPLVVIVSNMFPCLDLCRRTSKLPFRHHVNLGNSTLPSLAWRKQLLIANVTGQGSMPRIFARVHCPASQVWVVQMCSCHLLALHLAVLMNVDAVEQVARSEMQICPRLIVSWTGTHLNNFLTTPHDWST